MTDTCTFCGGTYRLHLPEHDGATGYVVNVDQERIDELEADNAALVNSLHSVTVDWFEHGAEDFMMGTPRYETYRNAKYALAADHPGAKLLDVVNAAKEMGVLQSDDVKDGLRVVLLDHVSDLQESIQNDEHWLIECSCGWFRNESLPKRGEAIALWIEHVLEVAKPWL